MTGHRTIEAANRDIARASCVTAVVMFGIPMEGQPRV